MLDAEQVKADMPVVCSKGGAFAVVDHMEGSTVVKLKKDDNGQHHYMPLGWVASVNDGQVAVDRTGEEAMRDWSTSPDMPAA